MHNSPAWYVIKRDDGHCEVLPKAPETAGTKVNDNQVAPQCWGPFNSETAAIAHRIGLIRAGKCQPVQP